MYSKPMKATETLLTLGFFRTTTAGVWISDNQEMLITVAGETITYTGTEYTPEEFWNLLVK